MICDRHKNDPEKQKLLEEYKSKHINANSNHNNFSKNITIAFHVDSDSKDCYGAEKERLKHDEGSNLAIYMLQTIQIQNKNSNLFLDSVYGDLMYKKEAVMILESMGRATKIYDGPLTLSGVGDNKTSCKHGLFSVKLPLFNGREVNLSGVCLDKITSEFPNYPLKEVEKDIRKAFRFASNKNDPRKPPKLSHSVGGDTDLMTGIQYLKYSLRKGLLYPMV